MKSDFKVKIIITLFAVATILVTAILILNYAKVSRNEKAENSARKEVYEISRSEIKRDFFRAFENWGFESAWIKSVKVDSLKNGVPEIQRVEIPKGVTTDFILLELNSLFLPYKSVSVFAKDLPKRRKTEIKILQDGKTIVLAYAKRNGKLIRKSPRLALILNAVDEIPDGELLRNDEFKRTVLLPINSETKAFAEKLSRGNKNLSLECAFLLNDDISEYKYSLSPELSAAELKASVRRIVGDFGKNRIYFYDPESELARAIHFEFVKKRFRKYAKLLSFSAVKNLTGKSKTETETAIKLILTGQTSHLVLIDFETYNSLKEFFVGLWKKGVKFAGVERYVNEVLTRKKTEQN